MNKKIINSVPAYVSLATCFINEVLCYNNNPTTTTTVPPLSNHLTLGGSFGYVLAGIVTMGLCISMLADIYKSKCSNNELESLKCVGEDIIEYDELV